SDERQRCLRFELTTQPRARVFAYQDRLGNVIHHFDMPGRHVRFSITADAIIEIEPAPPVPESLPVDTWTTLDAIAASGDEGDSLPPSGRARETPLLADVARELDWERHADLMTLMRRLNYGLFHQFTYAPRSTRVDSP